jgi:hypothetical protein
MSNFDDYLTEEIGHGGRDGRENTSNPILPPYSPIGSNPQLDIESRPSRPLASDPYPAEERLAIQEEGNKVGELPEKLIPTLAEQARTTVAEYDGDWRRAAADLLIVGNNRQLAAMVEAIGERTTPGDAIFGAEESSAPARRQP